MLSKTHSKKKMNVYRTTLNANTIFSPVLFNINRSRYSTIL